jgi:hypothetical protein
METHKSDLAELFVRIERLEKQNRRWKIAGSVALLSAVALVCVGAGQGDRIEPPSISASTVEAREFVLKDADGHIRARLSFPPTVRMERMVGPGGLYQLLPGVDPDQAALQFYDEDGNVVWFAPTSPTFRTLK